MTEELADAVVCGGGPAGLAAALWLGRYRRPTVLLDGAQQRNLSSTATHGYLTRDGAAPGQILEAARAEVARYPAVTLVDRPVSSIERRGELFAVDTGELSVVAQRVVIATGTADLAPDIPGFDELYGRSIFHCSCCDGYEARGQDVVAIGWGEHTAGYALDLLDWGATVTLVTNGETFRGDEPCRDALRRHHIELIEDRVVRFEASGGRMTAAVLASGRRLEAGMAFFSIGHVPRSELAARLGCEVDELGYIVVGPHGETSVEGVYAAGDVTPGEQLVQVAAAEGAIAGIACAMSIRGERSLRPGWRPGPDPSAEVPPPSAKA